MPTRDRAPYGAPCWIELSTTDVEASRRFYAELFGWDAGESSPEFGGYFMFTRDGVPIAGGMPTMEGAPPNVWGTYFGVADADEAVAAVEAGGGQVWAPPMDVADLGRMAWVADASGAGTGLWQAGTHHGFGVEGEPGSPCWFHLNATDYAGSLGFYRDLFAWEVADAPDSPMPASVVTVEGQWVCGVGDMAGRLPEGVPPHWAVFLGAEETPAGVERAVGLGASVVMPTDRTPWGRLAGLVDPTGAAFFLVDGDRDA